MGAGCFGSIGLFPPAEVLQGIGSHWPHYFSLNQPKEGFSQAQRTLWRSGVQGGAVTHLQQPALAPHGGEDQGTQHGLSPMKI